MSSERLCTACGEELPAKIEIGLCPQCVKRLLVPDGATFGASHSETDGDLAVTRAIASSAAGDMIGRYKILQLIGQGGFGTVYLAEQLRPVSRRVAVKIINLGMDTGQVIARFEAERQALAVMNHPN